MSTKPLEKNCVNSCRSQFPREPGDRNLAPFMTSRSHDSEFRFRDKVVQCCINPYQLAHQQSESFPLREIGTISEMASNEEDPLWRKVM